MKSLSLGSLCLALVIVLGGCFSAPPPVDVTSMNIPNPYMEIAPLAPSDYTVLGRIEGTGEVTYNSGTQKYTGDTYKYGSLGAIGSIGSVANVQTTGLLGFPTGTQTVVNTPSSSREMAISNATYELIEKAKAMGADALIFVTTSVEAAADAKARTSTSKATVSGIAIKMK